MKRTKPALSYSRIPAILLAIALGAVLAGLFAAPAPRAFADPVTEIEEGVPYRLICADNTKLVAEFDADNPTAGTKVHLAAPSDGANQVFTFTSDGNGGYFIHSYYNPSLLLTAETLAVYGVVDGNWRHSSHAQVWRASNLGDGVWRFKGGTSRWYLGAEGSHAKDGCNVIMRNNNGSKTQKWILERVDPATITGAAALPNSADGTAYRVVSVSNPRTVVSLPEGWSAEGTLLTIAAGKDSASEQVFLFDLQTDGVYFIHSQADPDLYLTANTLALRGGVEVLPVKGKGNRAWVIDPLPDGTFRLMPTADPDWFLDTTGSSTAVGSDVIMYTANSGDTQKWTFMDANESWPNNKGVIDVNEVVVAAEIAAAEAAAAEAEAAAAEAAAKAAEEAAAAAAAAAEAAEAEETAAALAAIAEGVQNGPVSGGAYRLVSVANRMLVAGVPAGLPDSGTAVVMARMDEAQDSQVFLFEQQADGTYLIHCQNNPSLLLTAIGTGWRAGITVSFATGERTQSWVAEPGEDGTFHLISAADVRMMLDVNGETVEEGAGCILWGDNGGDTQKWMLAAVAVSAGQVPGFITPEEAVIRELDIASVGSAGDAIAVIAAVVAASGETESSEGAQESAGENSASAPEGQAGESTPDTASTGTEEGAEGAGTGSGTEATEATEAADAADAEAGNAGEGATSESTAPAAPAPVAVAAPEVSSTALYRIRFASANLVLKVDEASAAGSGFVLAAPDSGADQVFFLESRDGGTVAIRSYANPSLYLTAPRAADGAPLQALYVSPAADTQTWIVDDYSGRGTAPRGAIALRAAADTSTTLCVTKARAGEFAVLNGGSGDIYETSLWILEPVEASAVSEPLGKPTAEGGPYRIVSLSNTGVVVQVNTSGSALKSGAGVSVAVPNGGTNQTFTFEPQADGTYLIRSAANRDLYLTANSLTERGRVGAWTRNPAKAQAWSLERQADGSWHIVAAGTGWLLDTNGSTTAAGVACIMWKDNGGLTQKWAIEAVVAVNAPTAAPVVAGSVTQDSTEAARLAARAARAAAVEPVLTQDIRQEFIHGDKDAEHTRWIVIHDTADSGTASEVIDWWAGNGQLVAAHFVINTDGTIVQCVPMDKIAHHAGYGDMGHDASFNVPEDGRDDMRGTVPLANYPDYGMNGWSIGIELVHENGSYPEAQLVALDNLIAYIDEYLGHECSITVHKEWRTSNTDTSAEFDPYLTNLRDHRTHSDWMPWMPEPTVPTTAERVLYRIVSADAEGLAMQLGALRDDGTRALEVGMTPTDAALAAGAKVSRDQIFFLAKQSDGTVYLHAFAADDLLATVSGDAMWAPVVMAARSASAAQAWTTSVTGDGYYRFACSTDGGLRIGVATGEDTEGAAVDTGSACVVLSAEWPGFSDRWVLQEVSRASIA